MTIKPINEVRKVIRLKGPRGKLQKEFESSGKDGSIISEDAKRLQKLWEEISLAKNSIDKSPNFRLEKIQTAKERISKGFYSSEEVARAISEKISERLVSLLTR
jgi:hypothetical protein